MKFTLKEEIETSLKKTFEDENDSENFLAARGYALIGFGVCYVRMLNILTTYPVHNRTGSLQVLKDLDKQFQEMKEEFDSEVLN